MPKFTNNNQMEKLSRIAFESFVHPWDCRSYEHDVGIDLIVQPYDESLRNPTDASLPLFEKRFLVQLKATNNEKENDRTARISIDIEHLRDWQRQKDPVMIARYYISEDAFYYTWIDQIEIKNNQESQMVYLDNILNQTNKNISKEEILSHILPMDIGGLSYIPDIENPLNGAGYVNIANVRSQQQLDELFKNGFLKRIEEQMLFEQGISSLKQSLFHDPQNINLRFQLIMGYIKLKNYPEAIKELAVVIQQFGSKEAKILYSILSNGRQDMLEDLNSFNFVTYFKWRQETPSETSVTTFVIFDNKRRYELEYNPDGVILPEQEIRQFQFGFNLKSDNGLNTPIVYTEGIYLMRGLVGKDGCVLYKFGEILRDLSR